MGDTVIKVEGVAKKFCKRLRHSMYHGTADVARGMLGMESRTEVLRPGEFWAVEDVSFELKRGETLGLIGPNGSGKSTLLRLINGIYPPDKGRIEIRGRIGALIAVGAGFHPLMTGRENIHLNGAILGMSRAEIDRKFDSIVDFAEIGEFLDAPVKTYSSGMYVRLGFAVAIHSEPEVLLVDEVLAVGDMFFQAKCMTRIKEMLSGGVALVMVSHAMDTLKSVCGRGVLLNRGAMVACDTIGKTVEKYYTIRVEGSQATVRDTAVEERAAEKGPEGPESKDAAFSGGSAFRQRASFQRIQNGKACFANVLLLDASGKETKYVEFGQEVTLRMALEISEDLPVLSYGYHIRDRNGVDVVYSGSNIEKTNLSQTVKGERYIVDWKFRASLMQGVYNIACMLAVPLNIEIAHVAVCDFVPLAFQFEVAARPGARLYGLVHWENDVSVKKIPAAEA